MTPASTNHRPLAVLAVNAGSSSIKFAVFELSHAMPAVLTGQIERIGSPEARIVAKDRIGRSVDAPRINATDHAQAAKALADWLGDQTREHTITAIAHRIVHGGRPRADHERATESTLKDLKNAIALDPTHLPREIELVDTCITAFPAARQLLCFDTVFHNTIPIELQLLPIPRRYFEAGIRRYGFHGLSYEFLMQELARVDSQAARRRVIFAHLGSGASMAGVRNGSCLDTTMSFTPASGIVMGTRPGDLDPGILIHLARTENMGPRELDDFINRECGLKGLSGTSSDVRDLLARRDTDENARHAIAVFISSARKAIGALAATLGGIDTLVFSGGIGEHAAEIRSEICAGLGFLGIRIDPTRNGAHAPVISSNDQSVTIRIIPTNEERMMALHCVRLFNLQAEKGPSA